MSQFLESPRFPGCPSFGFLFRPRYRTEITVGASGWEKRDRLWAYPLHDCQVTVGPRMEDEIDELLEFFHVVAGEYYGFRMKVYGDFKSCRPSETPTALDQPMVATGVTNEYQLVKRYTLGAVTQDRPIYKPVGSTILVSGGAHTLDATTGLVTFAGTPSGTPSWGGEFDVPVRFQGDFPIEIINKRAHTVSFMLEELRGTAL